MRNKILQYKIQTIKMYNHSWHYNLTNKIFADTIADTICTANSIVYLCRDRDDHRYDVYTHSDIIDIIQMICNS